MRAAALPQIERRLQEPDPHITLLVSTQPPPPPPHLLSRAETGLLHHYYNHYIHKYIYIYIHIGGGESIITSTISIFLFCFVFENVRCFFITLFEIVFELFVLHFCQKVPGRFLQVSLSITTSQHARECTCTTLSALFLWVQ